MLYIAEKKIVYACLQCYTMRIILTTRQYVHTSHYWLRVKKLQLPVKSDISPWNFEPSIAVGAKSEREWKAPNAHTYNFGSSQPGTLKEKCGTRTDDMHEYLGITQSIWRIYTVHITRYI